MDPSILSQSRGHNSSQEFTKTLLSFRILPLSTSAQIRNTIYARGLTAFLLKQEPGNYMVLQRKNKTASTDSIKYRKQTYMERNYSEHT